MENIFCVLGCTPTSDLYMFPSRKDDMKRRKAWLDFFDLEEPDVDYVFACERHFSHLQITMKGIRPKGVPDVPIISNETAHPFKRKPKNWRENVIVVTPRDPEFTIYRHETGVYPQNLFNISDSQATQIPRIKSVSCSMSTQTNTRLCGFVEMWDINEEYRLNCFYCSENFAIEKWQKFVNHLKNNHFEEEEAFKMPKYLLQDHDYTSSRPTAPLVSTIKLLPNNNKVNTQVRPTNMVLKPMLHPQVPAWSQINIKKSSQNILEDPPQHQSNEKVFDINLADRLIKLLNDTILNPSFLRTEEDNILVIKNTGTDNFDTSNFLSTLMTSGNSSIYDPDNRVPLKNSTKVAPGPKDTRPIYTINHGNRHVPSKRYIPLRGVLPPMPKNKLTKLVQKRIAQQTLKNINVFENIYKTVKSRHPKVIESENLQDPSGNKTNNLTPLSRCLKRILNEATTTAPKKKPSTEIVFEYSPEEIVVLLLESMKNYPVLWEFHERPYNKNYNKAIEELCRLINEKWSLNITAVKMRRSITRILRFYRFMLPRESIDTFEEYFDKCALFLPSSVDDIPRARCVYCCSCYKKDSELRKHCIEQHKCLKWPYKCLHCFERFREVDEYELHKRLPHYEEIFKCEQCGKRFNRRNRYNNHVSSHEKIKQRHKVVSIGNVQQKKNVHVCSICKREYKDIDELKAHIELHKVKCELCQKEYSSKTSLRRHMKIHRKEFDCICEYCGKGFIRQASLKQHMDTHTGVKVKCSICNLKLRKGNLRRHLRLVHVANVGTIESTFRAKSYHYKRYILPQKARRRNSASQRRQRQYSCKICKTTFIRLKLLKDHNKAIHSNLKKTPCTICNIEFAYIPNLKRHYRSKHKLHRYQIFKLVNLNEDLNSVLAMKEEELERISHIDQLIGWPSNQDGLKKLSCSQSDKIQDEIMKAVENIDKQEIQVYDDHSMNHFFSDLFAKHS